MQVIKYTMFTSSGEFEEWQANNPGCLIKQITPYNSEATMSGICNTAVCSDIDTTTTYAHNVFIT